VLDDVCVVVAEVLITCSLLVTSVLVVVGWHSTHSRHAFQLHLIDQYLVLVWHDFLQKDGGGTAGTSSPEPAGLATLVAVLVVLTWNVLLSVAVLTSLEVEVCVNELLASVKVLLAEVRIAKLLVLVSEK
jgi:hypothetical protein